MSSSGESLYFLSHMHIAAVCLQDLRKSQYTALAGLQAQQLAATWPQHESKSSLYKDVATLLSRASSKSYGAICIVISLGKDMLYI